MKVLDGLLWLGLLLPMSVDGAFSVKVAHYSLRANYFALAVALFVFVFRWFRREKHARKSAKSLWVDFTTRIWLGFLAIGLISSLHSENLRRSAFFWLWTAGTLFGLRLVIRDLLPRVRWIPLSIVVYAAALSAVVWIDTVICAITSRVGPFLGRVVVTSHICRPHAWYQEPNYLAAFLIVAVVLCRQWILTARYTGRGWFVFGLILSGVFASTSRMGWIAAGGILIAEALWWGVALRKQRWMPWAISFGCVAVTLGAVVLSSRSYIAQSLLDFSRDASGLDRWFNQRAAFEVFLTHPWIGAAPGGAGAYLANHWPKHPYVLDRIARGFDLAFLRNDPLSHSLYLELLSEWGVLGTAAFLAGLLGMLRGVSRPALHLAVVGVPIVYLGAQSLPRFDLWVVLFVLSEIAMSEARSRRS